MEERIEKQNFKVFFQELTKDRRNSFFNLVTGFGYIFARNDAYKEDKVTFNGDDLNQVLEIINNNGYKIDLLEEYSVHSTLNVVDFRLFLLAMIFLLINLFEEGKIIRIMVFQMFRLDLLRNQRPRRSISIHSLL